jgi:hypothetical protein
MQEETGEVLAVSLKNSSIKLKKKNGEEKWLEVMEKAKEYLNEIYRGDKVKFKEENNKITSLQKVKEKEDIVVFDDDKNTDREIKLRMVSTELAIKYLYVKHWIKEEDNEQYLLRVADTIYCYLKYRAFPRQQGFSQSQQSQFSIKVLREKEKESEEGKEE